MKERELSLSGLMNPETAKEVSNLTGLDGIVFVETDFEVLWVTLILFLFGNMDARLVDIESGEVVVLGNSSFTGTSLVPILPLWVDPPKGMEKKIAKKVMIPAHSAGHPDN